MMGSFFFFYVGSFSYTSRAGFIFMWGVSLTHPVLDLLFCGEFLLHIPCWLHFSVGSFSYTSRADFIFMWGVSLTHPMLASFSCGEFLLHTLSWLHFYAGSFYYTSRAGFFSIFFFFNLGSFSYTSRAGFVFPGGGGGGSFSFTTHDWLIFLWEVSLTHPMLLLFCSCFLVWGVSLTHPLLALFLCAEFLLHIPYWLYFYLGSFSYTSLLLFVFYG